MIAFWEEKFITLLKKKVKTKEEVAEMQYARSQFEKELNLQTSELLASLQKVGLDIGSVWDLVNIIVPYSDAIDILTRHLSLDYHIRNKEGIIRALGVKEAGIETLKALLNEYQKIAQEDVKSAILNSIFIILAANRSKYLSIKVDDNKILWEMIAYLNTKKNDPAKFSKFFQEKLQSKNTL